MWLRGVKFPIVVLVVLILAIDFSLFYGGEANATNLTLTTGGRVSIELITSEATFSDTLSLVTPAASVAGTGCKLEAATGLGGLHLVSEKLSQHGCRAELDADPATAGIQPFATGTVFNFGLCGQSDSDANCEFVWSSDPAQNSDGFDHVRTTPIRSAELPGRIFQLAWEDLPSGGDMDFNDLIALVRIDVDTDGDGLWDDWERFGIDTNGDGTIDLDLPALGANPMHKDVFLEIDFMDCTVAGGDCAAGDTHSHRPKAAAVNAVVQAFANAPVTNPDGNPGISLRIQPGNSIPHQNFLDIPSTGCGGSPLPSGIGNFDTVKSNPANFGSTDDRRFAFYYELMIHRRAPGTTSSGCSELPGNDTVVSLGDWNTWCIGPGTNNVLDTTPAGDDIAISGSNGIFAGPNLVCNTTAAGGDVQFIAVGNSPPADPDGDGLDDRTVGTVSQQAGTIMHELGHNLNLRHGGDGDVPNFEPNYLSIMSYRFQMPGIPPDPDGTGPLTGQVDYSPTDLADLDERSAPAPGLNEPAGIGDGTDNTTFRCPTGTLGTGPGTGAINWNCDTDATDTGISVDINGDGVFTILDGFNDWANLLFGFQRTADFEDGVHTTSPPEEIDFPTSLTTSLKAVQIDIKPRGTPNSINPTSTGRTPVAILSAPDFNATLAVDVSSLTFGRTGDEPSLGFCSIPEDVNGDGLLDLVCHFTTRSTGFKAGDTVGILKGQTLDGVNIEGRDSVKIGR